MAEARDEPGALPLVENALHWLWQQRTNNRLSGRLFTDNGGLAGILSRGADALLDGFDAPQRDRALELLFRLVRVDREGSRHSRRSLALDKAEAVGGGGETGGAVVHRLSGLRRPDGGPGDGPLRLITVVDGRVNLIHETLIRSKGPDASGKPQPYWPTLWSYIEQHRARAAWRERLGEDVATWLAKGRTAGHEWSHERVREAAEALRPVVPELSEDERAFLGPIEPAAMLAELDSRQTEHRRRLLIGERLDVLRRSPPRRGHGRGRYARDRLVRRARRRRDHLDPVRRERSKLGGRGAPLSNDRAVPDRPLSDHRRPVSGVSGSGGWLVRSHLVGRRPLPRFGRQHLRRRPFRQSSGDLRQLVRRGGVLPVAESARGVQGVPAGRVGMAAGGDRG